MATITSFYKVFKWSIGEISGDKEIFQCSEDKHGLCCLCQAELNEKFCPVTWWTEIQLHLVTHSFIGFISPFGASIWILCALITPELQPG